MKALENFLLEYLLFFVIVIRGCLPYNLETRLPLFKYGRQDTKFGYSLVLHRTTTDETVDERGTLMVMGAPNAQYKKDLPDEEAPENPGGIFYCPITTDPRDCKRIRMDRGGTVHNSTTRITNIKDNQWLGATLASQGPGKFLVTCAHRYTQHVKSGSKKGERERKCGKCFLLSAKGRSEIVEIPPDSPDIPSTFVSDPCQRYPIGENEYEHKNRYGYSMAGASIALAPNDTVLGAPGTWAWTGSIFDFSLPTGDNDRPELYESPTCFIRERYQTPYGTWQCSKAAVPRDSYLGLSVAISTSVDTDSDKIYYAAGAPRGNHTGAVVFFKRYTDEKGKTSLIPDMNKTVYGVGIHSSFGYSIGLTDLNGDGLDDLIVGAPQYYERSHLRKAGGAIYVYLNRGKEDFGDVTPTIFYGSEDSFYGHSIATLGDIDQDGYNDFAVGAPYEDGGGTVHVYRGGENGPKESQVIKGSEYPFVKGDFQDIKGFGSSISGLVDADGNKYPDILIGTLSDSVALLRARPIISVSGELNVRIEELDLTIKSCPVGSKSYSCFPITYCLRFRARHAKYREGVSIKYNVTVDNIYAKNGRKPRLAFNTPSGDSIITGNLTLPRAGAIICPGRSQNVFFHDDFGNKLTDIEVSFNFELNNPELQRETEGDPIFKMINDPILDADLDNKFSKIIGIKNTCGKNGCQSNLKISASMEREIIVGKDKTTTLTVNVENTGEEAHQAFIEIYLPPNVLFDSAIITDPSLPGMRCHSRAISVVRCELGNPYMNGMKDQILISLVTEALDPTTKTIDVRVAGHTISDNPKIAAVQLQALVLVEVDLSLTGYAEPEVVSYELKPILGESAMKVSTDIGELLKYTFSVANLGLQRVGDISVNIQLPIEIFNGKWLLYPFDTSVITGSGILAGSCNSTNINTLHLERGTPVSAVFSPRNKRALESAPSPSLPVAQPLTEAGRYTSSLTFSCDNDNAHCVNIHCDLDELDAATTTDLILQVHVWEATFLEEYKDVDLIYVKSSANLESRKENVRFKGDGTTVEIRNTVVHGEFSNEDSRAFPWWYILIGVFLILLLYIAIIAILVRCGFFKRKKFPRDGYDDVDDDDEKKVEEKKVDDDRL